MKQKVVCIIPTYNEKDNIKPLLKELDQIAKNQTKYSWTTLVVDDKSPDGTGIEVTKFNPKWMKLLLLSERKAGLGVAICRGIKFSLNKLSPDIIITNEADFAYDTKYLIDLLKKIEAGWDVVLTTRHAKKNQIEGWDFNRKFNHFMANKIFAGWIAGINQISDHNGLLRAMKVNPILTNINWNKITVTGFGFINYWCFLLTQQTDKIYQLPIKYKFRTRGESKVSFNYKYIKTYVHDVFEYVKVCIKIRIEKNESQNKQNRT